jgi:hypothetical protein
MSYTLIYYRVYDGEQTTNMARKMENCNCKRQVIIYFPVKFREDLYFQNTTIEYKKIESRYSSHPVGICFESDLKTKELGEFVFDLLFEIYGDSSPINKTRIIIY